MRLPGHRRPAGDRHEALGPAVRLQRHHVARPVEGNLLAQPVHRHRHDHPGGQTEIDDPPVALALHRCLERNPQRKITNPLAHQFVGPALAFRRQPHVPAVTGGGSAQRRPPCQQRRRLVRLGHPQLTGQHERHATRVVRRLAVQGQPDQFDRPGRRTRRPDGQHQFRRRGSGEPGLVLERGQTRHLRNPPIDRRVLVHPHQLVEAHRITGGEQQQSAVPVVGHLGLGRDLESQLLRQRTAFAGRRADVQETRSLGAAPHGPVLEPRTGHAQHLANFPETERQHLRLALVHLQREIDRLVDLLHGHRRLNLRRGREEQRRRLGHLFDRHHRHAFAHVELRLLRGYHPERQCKRSRSRQTSGGETPATPDRPAPRQNSAEFCYTTSSPVDKTTATVVHFHRFLVR
jgi:hypothetical protein